MLRLVGLPGRKNHTRVEVLQVNILYLSYSQSNDSMVLHHSCSAPGPWMGSTGEMISSRAEVYVYLRGEPPLHVKQVGK